MELEHFLRHTEFAKEKKEVNRILAEGEMKDVILRGHHLRLLYQYYIMNVSPKDMEEDITRSYGKEHAQKAMKILSKIVDDKNLQVKFTDELDDICRACPLYSQRCENGSYRQEDMDHIKRYHLKTEKYYNQKEILKKLKKIDGSFMFNIFRY